jgi:CheY-like chemotaxis protein
VTFTPVGGRIDVSSRREPRQAVVTVRDTGTGIAPEMLERVFELFIQANTSLARAQGGLGIGLTLTRRLIEMHGGTIAARSAGLGQGSEFELQLPLDTAELEVPAAPPATPARKRRLLIVEDNRDARKMLHAVLELHGHRVWEASDGAGAVRLAVDHSPEVVILDLGLPDMDGFETARRIRRRLGQQVRLIALSGYGDEDTRRRSREAGFDLHLIKPVSPERLVEAIERL